MPSILTANDAVLQITICDLQFAIYALWAHGELANCKLIIANCKLLMDHTILDIVWRYYSSKMSPGGFRYQGFRIWNLFWHRSPRFGNLPDFSSQELLPTLFASIFRLFFKTKSLSSKSDLPPRFGHLPETTGYSSLLSFFTRRNKILSHFTRLNI